MRKTLTHQEQFDQMVEHLNRQVGEFGDKKLCAYRTMLVNRAGKPAPYRCPVGALIPDEDYFPELEGSCSHADEHCTSEWAITRSLLEALLVSLGYDPVFCLRVQKVHDNYPATAWLSALRDVAIAYGLSMPVCSNLRVLDFAGSEV